MATQKKFYHTDTEKKLKAIENYLQRYLMVFKYQQNIETIYIDAFAGSGSMPIPSEHGFFTEHAEKEDFVIGSAVRAMQLGQRFTRYVFIEENRAKLNELRNVLEQENTTGAKLEFIHGNANVEVLKLCPHLSKANVRAAVFLDPFGNQVGWSVLKALADTKHVDLWYLFPAFVGVYRQIGNQNAKMTPEQVASLNHLFGPHDWHSAFIKRENKPDLFGDNEMQIKIADVEDITRYKIKCLKTIFAGGVSDNWLPLGRKGAHWYSLIFAMANPTPAATKIGHAMANHIMTRR